MPTSVALGCHFEAFVKSQIQSGRYNNSSEVVREGLRLLEDQETLRKIKLEKLRAEIQKGIESGSAGEFDMEDVFAEVRARVNQTTPNQA